MAWFSDDDDEYKALLQISKDSDRSAAIVGGSIIERRLERAIRSRLRLAEPIAKELFGINAPLGAFKPKVDLAHMMGLLSKAAHKDLIQVQKIRNAFAHKLEITEFKQQPIVNHCENLRLVDTFVGDSGHASKGRIQFRQDPDTGPIPPVFLIPRAAETLKDPRQRFLFTAKVFTAFLSNVPVSRPNRDWL